MPTLEYPPGDFPVYGMDETGLGHVGSTTSRAQAVSRSSAGGSHTALNWTWWNTPVPWARVATVPRRRWPPR